MSLDLALVSFTEQAGQEYFKSHMDELFVNSVKRLLKNLC